MKLILKEDPKEWRKVTLQTALAVAVISSVLRWRKILSADKWLWVLGILFVIVTMAFLAPRLFRGFYRMSTYVGYWSSRLMGHVVLMLVFCLAIVPFGILMRIFGKDLLAIKKRPEAPTYWSESKPSSPLDSQF
jgi:hypothetical protein